MKMQEALDVIEGRQRGFCVAFETVDGNLLRSDHFPDIRAMDTSIETESEAWQLAERFAKRTFGKCVNIRVVSAYDFRPVGGRTIVNRRAE